MRYQIHHHGLRTGTAASPLHGPSLIAGSSGIVSVAFEAITLEESVRVFIPIANVRMMKGAPLNSEKRKRPSESVVATNGVGTEDSMTRAYVTGSRVSMRITRPLRVAAGRGPPIACSIGGAAAAFRPRHRGVSTSFTHAVRAHPIEAGRTSTAAKRRSGMFEIYIPVTPRRRVGHENARPHRLRNSNVRAAKRMLPANAPA
jgi:hypothetical protein